MAPSLKARVAAVLIVLTPVAAAAAAETVTEREAVRIFLEQSPEARLGPLIEQSVAAEIRRGAPLPNPAVAYQVEDAAGVRDQYLTVQQALPITGRQRLVREAADAGAQAAGLAASQELRASASAVRQSFYEVLYGEGVLDRLRQGVERLRRVVDILAKRESEGEGSGYDLLRAEQELAELGIETAEAEVALSAARSRFGSFFDPAQQMASARLEGTLDLTEAPPATGEEVDLALARRDDLKALRAEARRLDLEREAARRQRLPEPTLSAGWKRVEGFDLEDTGFIAALTIPLPIFDRGQIESAQAAADLERSGLEAEILDAPDPGRGGGRPGARAYGPRGGAPARHTRRAAGHGPAEDRGAGLRRGRGRDPRTARCLSNGAVHGTAGARRPLRSQARRDRAAARSRNRGDPMNRALSYFLLVALLGLTLACGTPDHPADASDHGDHGHAAEGAERPTVAETRWTERTELFMEYPVLVAGESGRSAIHVTDLRDFTPLREGEAIVELRAADGHRLEFRGGASRPGIFGVDLAPDRPGAYEMTLRVDAPGVKDVHALGMVTVHAADAVPAAAEEEDDGGISFLKEQQWTLEFGTTPAAVRSLGVSVTVPGSIVPRPGGDATLAAPVPGRIDPASIVPIPGTRVRAGETLVRIAPRSDDLRDAAGLRAALVEAEQDHALAVRQRDRAERLVAARAAPQRRLEEAEAALAAADARLRAAQERQARFESLSQSGKGGGGGMFAVRAPFDGIVAEARFSPGGSVEENEILARIVDPDRVQVVAAVPEASAARLGSVRGGELLAGDGSAARAGAAACGRARARSGLAYDGDPLRLRQRGRAASGGPQRAGAPVRRRRGVRGRRSRRPRSSTTAAGRSCSCRPAASRSRGAR